MTPSIELAPGADSNGLAEMISGLIRQNLEDNPKKGDLFRRLRGRAAIVVEDADVSLTLHFHDARLVVHDGVVGVPNLTIRAQTDDVMGLSLLEILPALGIPDPRGTHVRQLISGVRSGRVKMSGMWSNLRFAMGLTRLMAVG